MGRPLFMIGGCAYRQQVHVNHAAAVAMLASIATVRDDGPMLAGIHYIHTSNLPQGRCLWLRDQIADKQLKWAISVDSDTVFTPQHLLAELKQVDGQTAIGIAPVRIGGTTDLCNINLTQEDENISAEMDGATHARDMPIVERRVQWGDELKRVLDGDRHITSGGFGVVVFNLEWFRAAWPLPAPEFVSIATGEDTELCKSVRRRGGIIKALKVATDHFAWGEKQTR